MLAVIRQIVSLENMESYDNLQLATVGGWNVVVKRGDFKVGDFSLYFSIGSILPINDATKFLCDNKGQMKRLKTKRFRTYLSQGLAAPLSWLPIFGITEPITLEDGIDLTDRLGVLKYIPEEEAPVYRSENGRSNWPQFIPKTDEPRVQNVVKLLNKVQGRPIVITQKYDGTSTTFGIINGRFFVCSRNNELEDTEINKLYWDMARKYNVEVILKSQQRNLAIQGETIGPKINGNRHGNIVVEFYVFNIYDIDNSCYLPWNEVVTLCNWFGLNTVPVVFTGECNHSCSDLLTLADTLTYTSGKPCEGVVVKTTDILPRFSAKAISNLYLEKYGL